MPLYNYKCSKCEHIIEKFQHNPKDVLEVTCEECGTPNCEKQLPFSHNRVWLDSREMLKEKIGPDAQRIVNNLKKGKDSDFLDIYGDK